jgi:excisionase family DNA binding protein
VTNAANQNPFDLLLDQIREMVAQGIERGLKSALSNEMERPAAPKNDWARAEELAQEYGLPKTLFEEAGRKGEIKRTKPGRNVLFNRPDVARWIQSPEFLRVQHRKKGGKKDH